MREIIKVNHDEMTVSARDLHEALGVASRFSRWFDDNKTLFVEGEDYNKCTSSTVVGNGAVRELDDYTITVLMAKHISLMSRTEKGKEVRNYLIDLEKAWNTPEQVMARALKIADQTIASLTQQNQVLIEDNERMRPKEEFFDAVTDSRDAISMGDVAKVLGMGIGRNKLFEFLRDKEILQRDNRPYQKYIDRGYFRVVEQKFDKPYGEIGINIKTLVFQSGVDFIRKRLVEEGCC